jgi:hypothetical protein
MAKMIKKTVYHTALKRPTRARGFADGLVMGLASMLVVSTPKRKTMRRVAAESSEKALRGDFVRIGMDMRKAAADVIEHEETAR